MHSVLVVAQDVEFLRNAREWFADRYNVVVVKSAEQAQAYLKNHESELILIDADIKDQNSFEKEKIISDHFTKMSREEIVSRVDEFFAEGC